MSVQAASHPSGILAGGMADGTLNVWDAQRIIQSDGSDPLIVQTDGHHSGSVTGLQFNPHQGWGHSLASGGSDGEVLVMSLERPEAPQTYTTSDTSKHQGEVTQVAWNTGTHYILASADTRGSTCVWDMKQRKMWCEIKDPAGGPVSDIAWGPDGGTNIVTASGDDRNPVLKYWDLRSSTSLPLATLKGHTEGILSVSWCPTDPYLLMSCGKDNKTIIWDLLHLKPVYEFPTDSSSSSLSMSDSVGAGAGLFGGLPQGANGQKRYQCTWSPTLPAVAATCSFDRKVQFYSLTGFKSSCGRAPKWLSKPAGATFGFGGKLTTFTSTTPAQGQKAESKVKLFQIVENSDLVERCNTYHSLSASGTPEAYKSLCAELANIAPNEQDKEQWNLMKDICFDDNTRESLRTYLGFDTATLTAATEKYIAANGGSNANETPISPDAISASLIASNEGGDPFAVSPPLAPSDNGISGLSLDTSSPEVQNLSSEMVKSAMDGLKAESIIREAVVIGNFQGAVDCCVQAGLMAEALLLAQCGDQDLWIRTQARFFEVQKNRFPFLGILHAIINMELKDYVAQSELTKWKETLAVIATYGKSEEFQAMCESLASRLENVDTPAAILCYMCAGNVQNVVGYWVKELEASYTALGRQDTAALQRFVEKVSVFTNANPGNDISEAVGSHFATYSGLLASQGKLNEAPKYLQYSTTGCEVLTDRLYHGGLKPAGSKPPTFPFDKVVVNYCAAAIPESEKAKQAAEAASALPLQGNSPFKASSATGVTSMIGSAAAAVAAQPAAQPAAAPTTPQLPEGWTMKFDPNSGANYYISPQGASQWEAPPMPVQASAPKPVTPSPVKQVGGGIPRPGNPVVAATQQPAAQPAAQQPGMGFVARPLGGQQPSTFTPVTATPVTATPVAAAPVASPVEAIDSAPVTALGDIITSMENVSTPVEKRQLKMIRSNYDTLVKKAEVNGVSVEIMEKLGKLVQAVNSRDFQGASTIQQDLATTAWTEHGSWIKGIKMLLPILGKH
jgi:protein transport protein SEC31